MADTGRVLESKVELALASLAAGGSACPATLFLPWASERLPPELSAAFAPPLPRWVLKRDALSNGEGVFFPLTAADAEETIASQRRAQRARARMRSLPRSPRAHAATHSSAAAPARA